MNEWVNEVMYLENNTLLTNDTLPYGFSKIYHRNLI